MTQKTPDEAYADSVAHAQAKLEQAKAQAAEEAKWAARRKIKVTAVARHSSDPNSKKFPFYWVPGHKLAHGETIELELSEREIHNMKMDPFVEVDDSQDAVAQDALAKKRAEILALQKADAERKAKAEADIMASLPSAIRPPPDVPPAAAEGLAELQSSKGKAKK